MRIDELLNENLGHTNQSLTIYSVLKPAQGGSRAERPGGIYGLLGNQLHQRIFSQIVMVVEVFLSVGDGKNPLGKQAPEAVDNFAFLTGIAETLCQGVD